MCRRKEKATHHPPRPPPTGLDRLNGAEGTKCRGTGHRTCFQSDMWLGVVTGAESGLESEAHEKRFYGPGTSSQKLNSTDPRVWPRKQGGSGAELGRGTAGPNRLPRPLPGAELLPGPRRARGVSSASSAHILHRPWALREARRMVR